MRGYELSDFEWSVIAPLVPNKPRGVPRVDDRRVLNGIFWVLRTGAPWRGLPKEFGPQTTCYNRFVRWRKAGVWDRILAAVTTAYDGQVQMIDSTSVRVPRTQPHTSSTSVHSGAPSGGASALRARSTSMMASSRS